MQRIEREKDRRALCRARAALTRNRAAGQRKAPGQQAHLHRRVDRRADIDIPQRAAKLQKTAEQQRVQQRMMRRIRACDHLTQLIRHIVGKRAGKSHAKHRHIAGQNEQERPSRAETLLLSHRARIAAFQQHGKQRRNRPDEQRRRQQRIAQMNMPIVLRLPAKGSEEGVHRPAQQTDGQFSPVQFSQHAALSLPKSIGSVSQRAQKGNLRVCAPRVSRKLTQSKQRFSRISAFLSYFCHIPAL